MASGVPGDACFKPHAATGHAHMIFEQFRLSLVERDATLLDIIERPFGRPVSRQVWLQKVFTHEQTFTHRKQQFHFVPDFELTREVENIIVGRIGRKRTSKENEPPESGLKETERQAWQAMFILVDARAHEDGQKAALERDQSIAQCLPVFKSLVNAINRSYPTRPYNIEVLPLSEESSFWAFAKDHPEITRLTFEMIAPNMFGIHDDWDADMRELKATENADRARVQTESKDGMKVDTPRIHKGIEHVGRGTATLKARAKDRSSFSSDDAVKTVATPDKTDEISWNELLKMIVARIFRV